MKFPFVRLYRLNRQHFQHSGFRSDAVAEALKKGDKVTLVGFGTFSVYKREARTGRNPQSGKTIKIPAKNIAKFKAGSKLSEAIN